MQKTTNKREQNSKSWKKRYPVRSRLSQYRSYGKNYILKVIPHLSETNYHDAKRALSQVKNWITLRQHQLAMLDKKVSKE